VIVSVRYFFLKEVIAEIQVTWATRELIKHVILKNLDINEGPIEMNLLTQ
jgi:hypothetical protein